MRGDGKAQPHVHAAGVMLDGRVDELLDFGEGYDLVEFTLDLGAPHAEDRTAQVDVLASGQLEMEAGADLEQAAHAAVNFGPPRARFGDAREHLEQGRLAGAVASDKAEYFARHHLKA